MQSIGFRLTRHPFNYYRLLFNIQKKYDHSACYYATNDVESFTNDLVKKFKPKKKNNNIGLSPLNPLMDSGNINKDVTTMSIDEINDLIAYLVSKNKDSEVEQVLGECQKLRKFVGESVLRKIFRHYSSSGKPNMVSVLQTYCSKLDRMVYKRNCEFEHYMAKAQCFKGNAVKGLSILSQCYEKNENMRSVYRMIFRELIQDTVMNRSEASLVIFKKYVLELSKTWKDHYPLVCFWHMCWSSSWFSDQQLSEELLESSPELLEIIRDRATAFSITILREEYNEDAVVRLLQTILKYDMMDEYVKVLQVLFNYKLKNRDIRGCSEIMKNCEVLGVSLPSVSQGRYIKMIIQGKPSPDPNQPEKPTLKNFKLKF